MTNAGAWVRGALSCAVFLAAGMAAAQPAAPGAAMAAPVAAKALKQKIAIGRFSNETRYGQSLLVDGDLDPLGKQAADIMMAYLTQTGRFLVFERPDLAKIEREQARDGKSATVGVDTLVIGSVVEFGRSEDGKRGVFNRERVQRAHAKVAVRLVDVRTGLAFHAATGQGEATTQTRTVLGVGSTSRFDGTLTDKALSVAVEDMLDELVNSLSARPWRTDVLAVEGGQVFVSGGAAQGLAVGDRLRVMKAGRVIRSAQTGFDIALPASEVARIQIVSQFGDNETNQGSVGQLVSGSIAGLPLADLVVTAQ